MTPQEKAIVKLIAKGLKDKEIGLNPRVSKYAIKSRIDNIIEKTALNPGVRIAIYINSEADISGNGVS